MDSYIIIKSNDKMAYAPGCIIPWNPGLSLMLIDYDLSDAKRLDVTCFDPEHVRMQRVARCSEQNYFTYRELNYAFTDAGWDFFEHPDPWLVLVWHIQQFNHLKEISN